MLATLAAAICGFGSAVAYFGVSGIFALPFSPSGHFVRIALAPAVDGSGTQQDEIPANPAEAIPQDSGQPAPLAEPGFDLDLRSEAEAAQSAQPAQASAAPASVRQVGGTSSLTSLSDVSYDLAGGATSSNAIVTEKAIQVAGSPGARISVRIDENATIYVDAAQLAALLPKRLVPSSSNGFVSFDQLRSKGVDVRYDAALDRIEMLPDGA